MATRTKPAAKAEPVAEKAASAKAAKTTWGINELTEHTNTQLGTSFDSYNLRIVLRKLAKDGLIERGEGRYSFSGPNDSTVKVILKAIKAGDAEKAKKERLDGLKAKKAAAPAAKGSRRKPAVVEAEDEDEDLLEDLDED